MHSGNMQMDHCGAKLGAAAQTPGPMAEAAGALWQVLQPYLGPAADHAAGRQLPGLAPAHRSHTRA